MKEEHKSSQATEKNKRFRISRRLYIVLICFFISVVFWLLLALSKDYPASVTFPIVYTNLPQEKIIVNDLPDSIDLQIKATGFRILAYSFSSKRKALEIDVASRLLSGRPLQGEVLALPTRVFTPDFTRQFGPDISIYGYQPDSIIFYFSNLISRRLPVILNTKLQFEKQYDYSDALSVSPDSIVVSGPPSLVNTLLAVESEDIVIAGVKSSVEQEVNLRKNKLLTYSADKVRVKIPVEKFTEGNRQIRIQAINVPAGYSLKTFPDRVNVRYQVALSKYNKVDDQMFEIVVSGEIGDSVHPAKLKLNLLKYPSFVRSLVLDPEKVDYILRKQ